MDSNAPPPQTSPKPRPRRAPALHRASAGVVAFGCLAILAIAFLLSPSAEGHGTHTALGLPPCGWVVAMDKPCPSCGMTTAFSHAARGDLKTAFLTQPFGALLAIATAACFWGALHVAATGSHLARAGARLLQPRFLALLAAIAAAAWIYKFITWT